MGYQTLRHDWVTFTLTRGKDSNSRDDLLDSVDSKSSLCNWKWVLTAHHSKVIKGKVGGKENLLRFGWWQLAGRADSYPKANSVPTSNNQRARAFTGWERELLIETAQSALTVILKLVISGLASVLLTDLMTINLQFRGHLAVMFFRPILGIVAACVMTTVWSSRIIMPPPGRAFNLYGPEYHLQHLGRK